MARHDAREISTMLAARIQSVVAELLPHGHREGHEWVHPSLTGTSRRSLSVHLSGLKAGVWSDFSSGDAGDALDLVATVSFGGNRGAALDWARSWLGLDTTRGGPQPSRPEPRPPTSAEDVDAAERQASAVRIFLAAEIALAGTPAEAYLAARGINLAELGRQPRSLRYHPGLHNRESGRKWPALLAAITGDDGQIMAVHRTWLALDSAGRWGKAPLRAAKMSLGRVTGGTIRLWRGASGKAMAKAPEGEAVAIGEGIETCLSVAVACPDQRVLSAVSIANMANITLPAAIRTVILLKDNDGDNKAAAKALRRAISHFQEDGRIVRIAIPPVGKDFNDTLRAGASE